MGWIIGSVLAVFIVVLFMTLCLLNGPISREEERSGLLKLIAEKETVF